MNRRTLLTLPLAALLSRARGTTREALLSLGAAPMFASLNLCHPYISWELCNVVDREFEVQYIKKVPEEQRVSTENKAPKTLEEQREEFLIKLRESKNIKAVLLKADGTKWVKYRTKQN